MRAKSAVATALGIGLTLAALQVSPGFIAPAVADSITACSRYGKGCVTAPVRRTRQGLEVRFPNGTWINCSGDCREKLRDEHLDFWDTHKPENSGAGGNRN